MNKNTHSFFEKIKQQNISSCNNSDLLNKLEALVQKKLHSSEGIKSAMTKMSNSSEFVNIRSEAIKNAKHIINNWKKPSQEAVDKIINKISKDLID